MFYSTHSIFHTFYCKSFVAPADITPIGQEFNIKDQFERLKSMKFKSIDGRKFQLHWLDRFDWIEYSVSRNAVFCNTCRQFGKPSQDTTFTISGFKSWQSALTKGRGLSRHNESTAHVDAVRRQNEKVKRTLSGKSVSDLVNSTVLDRRRYYCKTIVDIIIFLASNRLALRGDWNDEKDEESGLFNNLFQFTMDRDTELAACQKYMPPNVTYRSPIIQNEFIEILANLVRSAVVQEVKSSDADAFTILFDGTKDKNGNECISLAARFVANGKPKEALLFFETSKELDANAFTQLILQSLNNYGLDANKILSQCYDGASVMSGYKSGVAKRLEIELRKVIPYVHCFNHRLHLIIVEIVKQVPGAKQFFEQLQLLHSFFKKPKVKMIYDGKSVKRLLDTRWTGHLQAVKAVYESYPEIVFTLDIAKDVNSNLDGEDIAIAIGISNVIKQKQFVFLLAFMNDFLASFGPVDRFLQSRDISYNRAMPLIEILQSNISDFRTEEKFSEFMEISDKLLSNALSNTPEIPRARRNRRRSTLLGDFVVEDTIGERANEYDDIKSTYYGIIDVADNEMKRRFSENNNILLALSNSSNMDLNELKPLEELGIVLPSDYELKTAKQYIEKEMAAFSNRASKSNDNIHTDQSKFNMLTTLYEMRAAFPDVYKLYATIDTFGCSTAVCEASFSAFAAINVKSRLSMTNKRLRLLSFLAFENQRLKKISIDDVLREFNNQKDRKIQLF